MGKRKTGGSGGGVQKGVVVGGDGRTGSMLQLGGGGGGGGGAGSGGGYSMAVVKATAVEVGEGWFAGQEGGEEGWGSEFVSPPIPLKTLYLIFVNSNVLRQCVAAYRDNIDAFGGAVCGVLDPEAEDFGERLAALSFEERVYDWEVGESTVEPVWPDADEVEELKTEYMARLRRERASADVWLRNCFERMTLTKGRKRTREEVEGVGNGAWEVIRDKGGKPARMKWLSVLNLRPTKLDSEAVEVTERIRVGLGIRERKVRRKFRRWKQIDEMGGGVWFKEYGDPRYVSASDGSAYADERGWQAHLDELDEGQRKAERLATEIVHWTVPDSQSVWGLPRWYGGLRSVLGSAASEEVNLLYFDEKGMPPLIIMVENGKLARGAVERLKAYFEDLRGRKNFHKALVLEAIPADRGGARTGSAGDHRISIKIERLFQLDDGVFLKYDEDNRDKTAETMRVHRILRGAIKDFNRATAEAAMALFEAHVAQPLRQEFDDDFDRLFMVERGLSLVRYKTLAPVNRDAETLAKMTDVLVRANVLTPAEGRALAEDIFNRQFAQIKAPWVKQPMMMTLAGVDQTSGGVGPAFPGVEGQPAGEGAGAGEGAADGSGATRPDNVARRLVSARGKLASFLEQELKGLVEPGPLDQDGKEVARHVLTWEEMGRLVEPLRTAGGDA